MAGNKVGKEKLPKEKKRDHVDETKHEEEDGDATQPVLKKPKPQLMEYTEAQSGVPDVLAKRTKVDPDRASYERFDSYFPAVKFGPGDEK